MKKLLTTKEVNDFKLNGAIVLRKKFDTHWIKKLKNHFKEVPLSEILSGLKFANNRWVAKDAGVLKVGRKSILQKEIHSVTVDRLSGD